MFVRDNHQTAIVIAYKNPERVLLADKVAHRAPVAKRDCSYWAFPEAEMYTIPDVRVSERGTVNQASVGGVKVPVTIDGDNAIDIPLSHDDIEEAPKGVNVIDRATERATNIVQLAREVEVAALCGDPANFPDTNKKNMAAGGAIKRLNDNTGNPLKTLKDDINSCLVRPNKIVFGQLPWSEFSATGKVVSASLGNDGSSGFATRQRIAELLEVNEVLVGEAFFNIAKPGKAAVMTRAWGNFVLAFYSDPTVDAQTGGMTFALTLQRGTRFGGTVKDPNMGAQGGQKVRVGETTKPVIVASRAAFLWYNAVA